MCTYRNQMINEEMNKQIETLNEWVFKGVSTTDPLRETGPTIKNCTDFKPGDYIVYKDQNIIMYGVRMEQPDGLRLI